MIECTQGLFSATDLKLDISLQPKCRFTSGGRGWGVSQLQVAFPNGRNPEPAVDKLSNFNLENRVSIRMFVTPSVVFSLLGSFHFREFTILSVLLSQVDAISAVLLVIPRVIVFALAIVISPVFSPQRRWANHNGGQQ
jgi:hypothetical protein